MWRKISTGSGKALSNGWYNIPLSTAPFCVWDGQRLAASGFPTLREAKQWCDDAMMVRGLQ